ncbi:MAG: cellulose binding domain-containing protein [Ktedonobacteraceae bacterium]|nr:cellulose binding domain-containing protein [Ktedonobacteraceae bacterium]
MIEKVSRTHSFHKLRKLLAFSGLFTLLIMGALLTSTAALASEAHASTCSASYYGTAQDIGYTDQFTITNTGTRTLHKWQVQILFKSPQVIINSWEGIFIQKGSTVLIKNTSLNGIVKPGSSIAPGFTAVWNNNTPFDALSVKLNGVTCSLIQP